MIHQNHILEKKFVYSNVRKISIPLCSLLLLCNVLFAKNDSLTVYIFMAEDCPVCQNQTLPLRQLYADFKPKGVGFISVFSNPSSSDSTILDFRAKYDLKFPAIFDSSQQIAKHLKALITPEVVVINHALNEAIVYRGAVDNAYPAVGKRRTIVTEYYLRDALTAILVGSNNYLSSTKAVGCYITY